MESASIVNDFSLRLVAGMRMTRVSFARDHLVAAVWYDDPRALRVFCYDRARCSGSVHECMMPDTPHHPGSLLGSVSTFLERHFRHFNAATVVAAARGYADHLESGGGMMVTLAGAMRTCLL